MEGHLIIRHWGGRLEKVWVILDGQQVTCYEKFDLISQDPVNVKKVLNIRNAHIVKLTNDPSSGKQNTKFGISVTWLKSDGTKKVTIFDCADASAWSQWNDALVAGSKAHEEEQLHHDLPMKHAHLLGIGDELAEGHANLTKAKITRAYKKLCLKAHPDRGGDVDEFNQINVAYNFLLNYQLEEEEREATIHIDYEVCVEKAGAGIGLGLNVSYDQVRRQILVKSVNPQILIKGISEESGGHILAGDALIAIDRDDCSSWKLSRVKARLNAYRVPMGSDTHLTLERRVPKPEGYDESTAHLNAVSTHSPHAHVLKPVPEGDNVASQAPATAPGADYEVDQDTADGDPLSPGTTMGREEAHLFAPTQDPAEASVEDSSGDVDSGNEFDIDEEIRHFTESEADHSVSEPGGDNDGAVEGGSESEPYVAVDEEQDRMRRNDSPAFVGSIQKQQKQKQGPGHADGGESQQKVGDMDTNQLNDQYYDLDESYYVPVSESHGATPAKTKGAQDQGGRAGRSAAPPTTHNNINDSDSDVFYAVETGLVPSTIPLAAPVPMAAAHATQIQKHQVQPSYANDREINVILQSSMDPNVVIRKLIDELKAQSATTSRYKSHNDVLTAEVDRLTIESRGLRNSLNAAVDNNEASQLEILELTNRNESFSGLLNEKFSKVPGAHGRRLVESQEHLMQCNRARKEASKQISSLRYIISNIISNGNSDDVNSVPIDVDGTNENENGSGSGPSNSVKIRSSEYVDALKRAKDVQSVLQSLL